ncbi:MAG TPA: hypothetical protein VGW78_00290, partial [Candidatus Babeliales bacterium]|nr:hypothetical protein [Candidatus Babeliales bacterium]
DLHKSVLVQILLIVYNKPCAMPFCRTIFVTKNNSIRKALHFILADAKKRKQITQLKEEV